MQPYTKLVRDRIPEILDAKGVPYEKRIASSEEYRNELINKLLEEAGEFAKAGDIVELADVLEVVEALRTLPEYADVVRVQEEKREERGGFTERFIVSGEK